MAIIDFFDRGWRSNPTGTAYLQDEREYSFKEVGELSCRIANKLVALGLPKETKGAVWATNDVTAWACTLGLWRANMSWIPVGARNSAEENHYVLDAFDCEVLFFQKYFAPAIVELRSRLPKVKHWICTDGELPDFPGAAALMDWVKDRPTTRPQVTCDLDDVVMVSSPAAPPAAQGGDEHPPQHSAFALSDRLPMARGSPGNLAAAPIPTPRGCCRCRARHAAARSSSSPSPPGLSAIQSTRYRALPAADRHLPAAGHSRSPREGGFLLTQVLHVRRCADVGGKTQAGH
jgi:hypothetical protein